MNNKKGLFVLIIGLIVVYLIINFILDMPKSKKYKNTILLGSITKVEVENGKIKVFDSNSEISNQKVKLFFKNEFIDAYISSIDGENSGIDYVYNAYNESGESLIPELGIIAYTGDMPVSVKKSKKNSIKNTDIINDFAKSNNFDYSQNIDLDYLFINNLDIDNDGVEEYVYSVGFTDMGSSEKTYYSFVFLNKDNNFILIDTENVSRNQEHKKFYFFNLIDFNNDDDYEFVIKVIDQEYGPELYNIYNFDGTKFTKIGGE